MKAIPILALAQSTLVSSHYIFANLFHKGVDYSHWQFMRKWGSPDRSYYSEKDDYTPLPYNDVRMSDGESLPSPNLGLIVTKTEMRCNYNSTFAKETLVVQAGDELGFYVNQKNTEGRFVQSWTMYHPGPLSVYLGRVPEGKTAQNWEGEGKTWFKLYHDFPAPRPDMPPPEDPLDRSWRVWPNTGNPTSQIPGSLSTFATLEIANARPDRNNISILIPPSTPSGEYLFRIEQIQLDFGPQFYIACAQIRVENGGNGVPGPLVEIPGYYDPDDEMWRVYRTIYDWEAPPQPFETRNAGPPVWTG
ncbi:lytic polysaccharide monooxygenase [Amniculicola lignicola CBS 123094]|uniref:lytic cellulose monooxygenase (C4-dehydrogenating) n=1 Tax=Amniculicola lignicola CBS 123094 TaxID=1392246 RepID=A0A6A5X2K3_9PLEO|nr:lytic polysaccharide monooxygenase [Amniculicola lignicola CBS 123094]